MPIEPLKYEVAFRTPKGVVGTGMDEDTNLDVTVSIIDTIERLPENTSTEVILTALFQSAAFVLSQRFELAEYQAVELTRQMFAAWSKGYDESGKPLN